ncbi:MAG: hypothetical protein NZ551_07295 [Microscillaceae bacterium]|nr:hypothetical protein [Microscillaceae bacterium]MDW8460999.1 hypothetical protein [Cytophagales bacterium]
MFIVAFCSQFILAQAPETYVYRTAISVEKVMVQMNENMEITQVSYQGPNDKGFVKLRILKNDTNEGKLYTQRPDNQQKLTFTNSAMMGMSMFLPNDQTKEFSREIACKAPTGEVILTSGGPTFFPFFYAPNANAPFTPIDVPQEQVGSGQTLSTGEPYYSVSIPGKAGKHKLVLMNYLEDDMTTRLKLIAPNGKETVFSDK